MSRTLDVIDYLASTSRFRQISEKLYVEGDRLYKEAGLNFKASWFPVYYALAISETPFTILRISREVGFSHITVKNVIRELEAAELVRIEPDPEDKRSRLVSFTFKGQKLIHRLKPIWLSYASALKTLFQQGHPDFLHILNRIDRQMEEHPVYRPDTIQDPGSVTVVDYMPGLNKHFFELAGPWLTEEVNGTLKEMEGITLASPDEKHFLEGGFQFYACFKDQILGLVSLKRLDDHSFELANLFINPNYRNLGIETKLIDRCICRSMENQAVELWNQTSENTPEHLEILKAYGFTEKAAPEQVAVLNQTNKVMCLEL